MKRLVNDFFARMRKISWATVGVAVACVFWAAGCGKQSATTNFEEPMEPTNLKGTVWKLSSIVTPPSEFYPKGEIRKLEPADCEACYTLWFDTDYTFSAISISHRLKIDLRKLNPDVIIEAVMFCEAYDVENDVYCDSHFFREGLILMKSFTATSDELNFFYGRDTRDTKYLSFVPHNGDNPSTSRRGTGWKLAGIVDVKTGVLRELEPKECFECYWLDFIGDYAFITSSITKLQVRNLLELDLDDNPSYPWNYGSSIPLYGEAWPKGPHGKDYIYEDSWLFRCGISYAKNYELTFDELKLFFVYQEKEYYLLFKLTRR